MNPPAIDIIVPVWNRPEETRHCLANLAEHTPNARFILLDNASERETEILLQEFAEALGDRALLFRNDKIEEFVALVNKGLARSEAPVLALVKNTTLVGKRWLEPMLELVSRRPDAGLMVPRLVAKGVGIPFGRKVSTSPPIEITHADFAAVLILKRLHDRVGGFDEGLDGALWCLKDYSRRAWKEGFVTVSVPGAAVFHEEEIPLSSQIRREERVRESVATYVRRWGRDLSYCLDMPADIDPDGMRQEFETLLGSARLGHHFTVIAHAKTYGKIVRAGYDLLHENIVVERLPLFFASGAATRLLARLRKDTSDIRMIKHAGELFFCQERS
ncbi:MAG TPA: glycosyltransferase [Geobacteraceae bacterium]|nr:glycosyltransferase [Geobacteraceae bacterium]